MENSFSFGINNAERLSNFEIKSYCESATLDLGWRNLNDLRTREISRCFGSYSGFDLHT